MKKPVGNIPVKKDHAEIKVNIDKKRSYIGHFDTVLANGTIEFISVGSNYHVIETSYLHVVIKFLNGGTFINVWERNDNLTNGYYDFDAGKDAGKIVKRLEYVRDEDAHEVKIVLNKGDVTVSVDKG